MRRTIISKISKITCCIISTISMLGCNKEFLEQKPSTDIVSPNTLEDYQLLLDYFRINSTSALPHLSSDEYEIPEEVDWLALSPIERNTYVWAADIYEGQGDVEDWNYPYESIFYANSALDGLAKIERTVSNQSLYDHIRGQAFFIRAFAFFDLAKSFAPVYDPSTAATDLGIPLKVTANVDEIQPRATVAQTYEQIREDIRSAAQLLTPEVTDNRNRANRPAAYALGARVCLSMGDYEMAEKFADSCLMLYDILLDYNTISESAATPFTRLNPESMVIGSIGKNYLTVLYDTPASISITRELYDLYTDDDLRKTIFFQTDLATGLIKTKRNYSGPSLLPYAGLATDEVYLIKAECAARSGDVGVVKELLDRLALHRYRTGSYAPLQLSDQDEALNAVLLERRKQLVWRAGLRWDDIRRLNRDGAGIVLSRKIGEQAYTIVPNSPRYVFPIPETEVSRSNIDQNPR